MLFRGSFNRPNLEYSVRPKPNSKKEAMAELATMIKTEFEGLSGIVYALKIKECVQIFEHLKECGISCLPYHGDIGVEEREKTQKKWLDDKCQVVVG